METIGREFASTHSGECGSVVAMEAGAAPTQDQTTIEEHHMRPSRSLFRQTLTLLALLGAFPAMAHAADSLSAEQGTIPFSEQPDTVYAKKHIFPLWQEKVKGRSLPPAYGVMLINNWMDSDWRFDSAAVSLGGSNPISLDAAANATMDLNIGTRGLKADLWLLPFFNVFAGGGVVDIDVSLGLRDIPLSFDPDLGEGEGDYVHGDVIVPMEFDGGYYSLGFVLAGAYRHFYGAVDASWVKTSLEGNASLDSEGFWTFTGAPKIGYNAGLSQIYIGARYVSKNEHYTGTVALASGNDLGFDVKITTDTWAPNFGMRTVILEHWEFLVEVAGDPRHQITVGAGYRW